MADLDKPGDTLHFGPYRAQADAILGKGGMGVVYRGVHTETGESVAIKVVNKVADGHLNAIRREISALRRVRHPGIVPYLKDDVTDDGLPWVAMGFLQGRTLLEEFDALHAWPAGAGSRADEPTQTADPVSEAPRVAGPAANASARSLASMLTLIRRICAPLAFLHGEGLVHRDLKPENIFIRDDGSPVLLDLGIAASFGGAGSREELDVERCFGTPPYMAPEQIKGELVDARADLYALGCVLYECVTGQPPFTGETKDSILCKHLCYPPIPPSLLVPGLLRGLDDLILKLLAKRPQDRIGYATDVAAALVDLGAEDEPYEGTQPRAYLYRPEFQGHADTLATLESAFGAVSQRRGGLVLVRGESGVGKTRLMKEMARRAQEEIVVLTGSCVAPGAGETGATAAVAPPLHPLRPVLIAAADRARGSRTEADRLFGPRGKVLSPYVPELLTLPGQAEQPEPPPLPPENARARVLAALRETLWAMAEASPIVIMLDDLQWADDLTLSLLETLARAGLKQRGVLLVATYRVEEARPELQSLAQASGVTTISLTRLDAASVREMVKGMLARRAPKDVINALVRHTNGNPFFVAEYLRAAIEEKILRRDKDGRWCFDERSATEAVSSMTLPHTLAELIQRRLDRLGEEEKALAAWAAVLGQDLDDDLLLLGAEGGDGATDALAELMTRQILEETEKGNLRFVHDKIREIAYERIAGATRAALHLRAGEALEARYADEPEKAQALGHHFERAGLHERAFPYFLRAAEHAQKVYANGDAIRFYRAAIDALTRRPLTEADRAKLAELHESLGDVLGFIGRQKEARVAYRAALDATSPSDRLALARLHRKIGKTWEMRHEHGKALKRYKEAKASLGPAPALGPPSVHADAWWNEWLQIQIERISVHYWKAEAERIHALLEKIRPVMEQRGTALQRGHYFHALTQRNIQIERFVPSAETVRYARECVAAYEATGEDREGHLVLSARFSLAFILMLAGSLERAQEQMDTALRAGVRMGDFELQTRCLTYLTFIHRRLRVIDEAEELARRSLELAKAEQVREYVGAALGSLSWIALSRGDHAEAERAGREALSHWERSTTHVYPFEWLARLPLCLVALAQRRLEAAIEQARAVLDVGQQRLPDRLTIKLEAAIKAFEKGREPQARKALLEALEWALDHGYA